MAEMDEGGNSGGDVGSGDDAGDEDGERGEKAKEDARELELSDRPDEDSLDVLLVRVDLLLGRPIRRVCSGDPLASTELEVDAVLAETQEGRGARGATYVMASLAAYPRRPRRPS